MKKEKTIIQKIGVISRKALKKLSKHNGLLNQYLKKHLITFLFNIIVKLISKI